MRENDSFLRIINLETVKSTNDYAFELTRHGFDEVVLVRANTQTEGRGREGNEWVSPQNKGIYASFLLKPPNPLKELIILPLLFSQAVVRTLEDIVAVKIKWPNDVMVGEKKIAGVLIEARSAHNKADFVIAGVGININSDEQELPVCATSLYLETAKVYDIDELFRKFTTKAIELYKEFKRANIKILAEGFSPDLRQLILDMKEDDINEVMILR